MATNNLKIVHVPETNGMPEKTPISAFVTFIESNTFRFAILHKQYTPVLVVQDSNGNITISCQNNETAEQLFGAGGLQNVAPRLLPGSWEVEETIAYSPTNSLLLRQHGLNAAWCVDRCIIREPAEVYHV